jgi:hypothetical protein
MRSPLLYLLLTVPLAEAPRNARADSYALRRQAYLDREEIEYWKLTERVERYATKAALVVQQRERLRSRSHLDIAALRIEQARDALHPLDEALAALEQFYATGSLPKDDGLAAAVASKRELLKNLRQSATGTIARSHIALTRLIERLEHNDADTTAADDALRCVDTLDRELQTLMNALRPSHGCGGQIELLRSVIAQQRSITGELRTMHERALPYPVPRVKWRGVTGPRQKITGNWSGLRVQ